jgi:hypothetical protein
VANFPAPVQENSYRDIVSVHQYQFLQVMKELPAPVQENSYRDIVSVHQYQFLQVMKELVGLDIFHNKPDSTNATQYCNN